MALKKATDAELAALKEEHGSVFEIDISDIPYIDENAQILIRKPKKHEFEIVSKRVADTAFRGDADAEFAQQFIVYPSLAEYNNLADEYFGIHRRVVAASGRLVGLAQRDHVKKL